MGIKNYVKDVKGYLRTVKAVNEFRIIDNKEKSFNKKKTTKGMKKIAFKFKTPPLVGKR